MSDQFNSRADAESAYEVLSWQTDEFKKNMKVWRPVMTTTEKAELDEYIKENNLPF